MVGGRRSPMTVMVVKRGKDLINTILNHVYVGKSNVTPQVDLVNRLIE